MIGQFKYKFSIFFEGMFGLRNAKFSTAFALLSQLSNYTVRATVPNQQKQACVGIDLGTTFSCVYMYDLEKKIYQILTYRNPQEKIFPSTIYFTGAKDTTNILPAYLVGYEANLANASSPSAERYFYKWKPMVGQTNIAPNTPLANFEKYVTYKLKKGVDSSNKEYYYFSIKTNDGSTFQFTPTDFSSILLKELKLRIDALNYSISSVCITTPVYFTPSQDNEVKQAAVKAGFPVPHINKEPVAACVSYEDGNMKNVESEVKTLVVDVGGGTTDLSIIEVSLDEAEKDENNNNTKQELEKTLTVTRFVGNNFLGGENFNDEMADFFKAKIKAAGKTTTLSSIDNLRLRLFVESFKIALCNKQNSFDAKHKANPSEPRQIASHSDIFIYKGSDNADYEIELVMNTDDFDSFKVFKLFNDLFYNSLDGLFREDKTNGNSELSDSIQKVIFVGGSTRIPKIQRLVADVCKKAQLFFRDDQVDLAVGRGAAMICASLDPNAGDSLLSIQTVVPMTIGTRLSDRTYLPIIKKDVAIPCESFVTCTTSVDNQKEVLLPILVGVRPMADDNEHIGELRLMLENNNLPAGVPQIDVGIVFNSDYSFKVIARHMKVGPVRNGKAEKEILKEEVAFFDSKIGQMSQSKIDELLRAAELNKEADEQAKNRAEKIRLFETKLTFLERTINDAKGLNDLDKSYFQAVLEGNQKWLQDNKESFTLETLESKMDELSKTIEELGSKLTQAPPTSEQMPEDTGSYAPGDEEGRDVL